MSDVEGLDLYQELEQLVRELDRKNVEYALAGALALAVHGVVRATVDIDLLVLAEDVETALAAAERLGFSIRALPMTLSGGLEVRRRSKVAGDETLVVDFLLVDDSLRPAWDRTITVETEGGPLRVLDRDALIEMKTRSGREQDLADVRRLMELDG